MDINKEVEKESKSGLGINESPTYRKGLEVFSQLEKGKW